MSNADGDRDANGTARFLTPSIPDLSAALRTEPCLSSQSMTSSSWQSLSIDAMELSAADGKGLGGSPNTTSPSYDDDGGDDPGLADGDKEGASGDQLSFFTDLPGTSVGYTQRTTFSSGATAGSTSFDECSVDSIGQMLIRLEDDDPSLSRLVIDCGSIDKEAAAEVGRYLPVNTHLRKLCLLCGNRSRHREAFRRVVSGLRDNESVESVELLAAASCHSAIISRETASWLVPFFAHGKLKHLNVASCRGAGLQDLFVAMQRNRNIQRLTFQMCYWEEHNTDVMASSLPFISNLKSLSLVDINVPADGWPYLMRNIKNCKNLERLDLSWNEMRASIVYLLARNLRAQKRISRLSLQSCSLDDECVREISVGLTHHPSLTSLDISQNDEMSDRGVAYLRPLLLFNGSITELKVDGCGLSEQSRNMIETGLRYNKSSLRSYVSFSTFDFVDSIVFSCCKEQGNFVHSIPAPADHASAALTRRPCIPLSDASCKIERHRTLMEMDFWREQRV